jgi:hypothetical protein
VLQAGSVHAHRRRLIVLALSLCAGVAVVHAQPAQRRQEAADHFNRAQVAEKEGHYEEAIREYELAYSLVAHADVLYNIAFDYEKLQDFGRAADYYQRYLDERANDPPQDADTVRAKIRDLRAKSQAPAPAPAEPSNPTQPTDSGAGSQPVGPADNGALPPPPPSAASPSNSLAGWHGGLSYGLGFGDAPTQRLLAHGGYRIARRFDADAIIGGFGKNDHAAGVLARLLVTRSPAVVSFARATATVGYAKQDASSTAETKFPLGFEAGGGVQIGGKGKVEIDAVVRWVRGGWDAASTTADSFVNDEIAFAIDVGVEVDFGLIAGARRE